MAIVFNKSSEKKLLHQTALIPSIVMVESAGTSSKKPKPMMKIWLWNIDNAHSNNIHAKIDTITLALKRSAGNPPDAIFFIKVVDQRVLNFLNENINFILNDREYYRKYIIEQNCQDAPTRQEKVIMFYKQDSCSLDYKDLIKNLCYPVQDNVNCTMKVKESRDVSNLVSTYGRQQNGIIFKVNGIICSIVHFNSPNYTEASNGIQINNNYLDEMYDEGIDIIIGDMNTHANSTMCKSRSNWASLKANNANICKSSTNHYETISNWDQCIVTDNFNSNYNLITRRLTFINQDLDSIHHPLLELKVFKKV